MLLTGGLQKMRITFYNALFVSVSLHIIIPFLLLLWLWKGKAGGRVFWFVKVILTTLYFILLFMAGSWQQFSYFGRFLLIFVYVAVVIKTYINSKKFPFSERMIYVDWITAVFGMIISIVILVNIFNIFQCYSPSRHANDSVNLGFPFKNGTYMICFGGDGDKSPLMNYHYKFPLYARSEPDQSVLFAVDIAELNSMGRSSTGFLPLENESYKIYGETVYSPCDGEVVSIDIRWPDERPFAYDYPYNPGNSIVIKYSSETARIGKNTGVSEEGDIFILLGHLQPGSVILNKGDLVKQGDPIAKAGNSGWTTEPHLHIQAMKAYDADGAEGEGLPILFDGRIPVKNSLFFQR